MIISMLNALPFHIIGGPLQLWHIFIGFSFNFYFSLSVAFDYFMVKFSFLEVHKDVLLIRDLYYRIKFTYLRVIHTFSRVL